MGKSVIIIGGGIIGLSTAYFLQKAGHQVTIVDKSSGKTGASHINAGYITPSHFIPLAAPGMINKGLKWMLDSSSPFYVKPRLDLDFLKWSWAFKKSATKRKVEQAIPVIKEINLLARELYEGLRSANEFDFHYERKGLLMCYQSDKVGEEEWEIGQRGIQEGLGVRNLSSAEVKEIEPDVNFNIKGAVYYDSDAHMTPGSFMAEMTQYLKSQSVQFCINEEVLDIQVDHQSIKSIRTDKQELSADEVVLAAGSWSPLLSKKLGIQIPIQAGKGYSINSISKSNITVPAILCEAKVAVTPMDGFTRFAGTMEIGGINHTVNHKRVNAIANAVSNYYTDIQLSNESKSAASCGLRPCSPDGLPYIGRSSKCDNLTIATGHAMMGWSLGPATGLLVNEIISGKKPSLDLSPFNPDRRF